MAAETVRVDHNSGAYDVLVGTDLLEQAGEFLRERLGRRRLVVFADSALAHTPHASRLRDGLAAADLQADWLEVPGGEATKTLASYSEAMERVLALRPDRGYVVVAFGGGVLGDLGGFVAATLLRGVACVQIPTTLLAQVDSSVGGKTGINSRHGKNLIGAFHQPALVLADLSTLQSLPARQLRAGYAEVVKYGLLGDAAFFEWLEANGARVVAGDIEALGHAVQTSVRAKVTVVCADELERNDTRALLNLGHTFGHAYEALTGYGDRLLHGEAVALGMVQAFGLSVRQQFCPSVDRERMRAHLAAVGLPTDVASTIGSMQPEAVRQAMSGDKKAVGGKLALVLVRGIGQAFVTRDISDETLLAHLREAA